MSYISDEQVREMMDRYGVPREIDLTLELTPAEFSMLRGSRKRERSHDITFFIFKDRGYREFAAIAKPFFPPGVYRAPSGAAHPGEDIEEGGAARRVRRPGWRWSSTGSSCSSAPVSPAGRSSRTGPPTSSPPS